MMHSTQFHLIVSELNIENRFILKIRDIDIPKAEELFENEVDKAVKNITRDHYLILFRIMILLIL